MDSPSGKKQINDDATLALQLGQFLDEWYYRIIYSSIGRNWTRQKATMLLLDIFGMLGFELSSEDKDRLVNLDDEHSLTNRLIEAMPALVREQFEGVCLQIQTVLHEAARIRTAAESGDVAVAELFDEEAGSGGLANQVLKASVIFAAKEVQKMRNVHLTWKKNTDARVDRLLKASEEAEHANQNLLAIESQLQAYKDETKSKSKGMLLKMSEGKESALVHSVFSSWHGYLEKTKAENSIRSKFEGQIKNLEKKLFQFKEAQIANVRGVVGRLHMEETEALMHTVWKFWVDEVAQTKADGDTAEQLKAMQAKMDEMDKQQKNKAGQFMTRMAAGNDASLKNICLEAWIKFHVDYAKNKELEDQVRAQELAFKKHMDAKKDEAKAVLDRMSASSETGLLSLTMTHWVQLYTEAKKSKELEYALAENESRFKSLNGRQKAGAHNMQNRVNEQVNANMMQRALNAWLIETKVTSVEKHYTNKYNSKKKQLQGVQNLFKSFAMQLEQNLGADDDSSQRTHRTSQKHRKSSASQGMKESQSVPSLPPIA